MSFVYLEERSLIRTSASFFHFGFLAIVFQLQWQSGKFAGIEPVAQASKEGRLAEALLPSCQLHSDTRSYDWVDFHGNRWTHVEVPIQTAASES